MRNLLAGFRDFWRAQRLLFRKGLWPLFLIPGVVSALYFPISIFVALYLLDDAAGFVHDNWLPAFLRGTFTMWMLAIVMWCAGLYLGFLLFRNIVMILYSPVLSYLSEAAEDRELGKERPGFEWKEALHSAGRGTAMSLLTLGLALVALVISWVVALVPVVGGLLAIILMPLAQCFLAGLGFCDPSLERRGISIAGTFRHAWCHRGRTIGQGAAFTALLFIPLAGWFLAPSYGIVAGTLAVVELEREGLTSGPPS